MFDGSTMKGIRAAVSSYAASFDPNEISALTAQAVVDDAIATENMLATIKALAANRVADANLWQREGYPSAAHQLAKKSGTSVAKAQETLETAEALGKLPGLDAAARSGEVSSSQAGAIADAATKNPRAEERLMRVAKRGSLAELKDECARTKAAVEPDPEARRRAIHRSRFLRQRRTADGAGEVTYRSTLEEVAELMSIVRGYAQRVYERARAEGRREPEEAYLADGLLNATRAGAAAAKAAADARAAEKKHAAKPVSAGGGVRSDAATGHGGAGPAGGEGASNPGGEATSGPAGGEDASNPGGEATSGPAGGEGASNPGGEATSTGPSRTDISGSPTSTGPGAGSSVGKSGTGSGTEPASRPAADIGPDRAGNRAGDYDDDPFAPPVRPSKVIVRIDWASLVRGWPIDDEVCEIAGVGPVPVTAVHEMIASGDVFLAAVVTKGTDVVNVAHLGRRPNSTQRTALDWMNPTCTAMGCNRSVRLQTDHREDWADTNITLLSLLDGLCVHHHSLKTYKGWALVDGKGKREMVPPHHFRNPKYRRAGPAPPPNAGNAETETDTKTEVA